ncbi:MAG TPA: alkaline phosphatase family protein, partial [Thermoanaerobaculia bacterium]|nr:alkaline phosphatase family protein [Thermoanaerobaculia bacterium]
FETLRAELPLESNPQPLAAARGALRARYAAGEPRRVLVIGWDGADWAMIRPLLAAGKMPRLQEMMSRGIHGDLRSVRPLLSPLVWTTIATGKPAAEHGILDFLATDSAGNKVPVSSLSRKVPAIWSLVTNFGMTSTVIGWWATWPAEAVEGLMVSDRVAYQLFDYAGASSPAGKVYPESRWPEVQSRLVTADQIPYQDVRRFLDISREEFDRFWTETPDDQRLEQPVNHFRRILATTRTYHALALEAVAEKPDLTMVYYEGSDTVGHLFARFLPPRLPVVSEEDVRRYGRALPEFYVYLDELLGQLLDRAGDDVSVLLVSDHGFHTGDARPDADPADFTTGAVKWHRLHGVLAAAGPGFGRGAVDGASVFDVTPTILDLLGLPVPDDMEGRSLARPASGSTVRLASYAELPDLVPEVRVAASSGDGAARAAEDEERLRELAALGYIGGPKPAEPPPAAAPGPGAPAPADTGTPAAVDTALRGNATEAYNLATMHHNRGEYDEAIRLYLEALGRLPSMGPAWANLANVYQLQGRHEQAFRTLVEGYGKSGDIPLSNLVVLVEEAESAGRLQAAEGVLRQLEPRYGGVATYHAALGTLHQKAGRAAEAQREFRRTLDIDPLDSLALGQVLAWERQQGNDAEARRLYRAAVAKASGSLDALNELAVVALQQGWAEEAEPILRKILESDPGNAGILANLAATLMRQGRIPEATTMMQRSLERDPSNPRTHFNLGAMLAGQGRSEEALRSFRAALDNGLRTPRVYVAIAKMEFRLGRPERAREALQGALALDPGDAEARELLRLLEAG